ncbi:hypothetical protein [Methylocucumis oryzae]|uniref:Uncharacterized protein n=1 Tax=Methylocucumis oryzae TaxID=1632867 RepID=A0A0F3IGE3_9GAMM|nr:hypothetical protein [Methylocucumis oryzae]KJV05870.1 hypothetical protein VZ94_15080 [Methylocucumis oryzae]
MCLHFRSPLKNVGSVPAIGCYVTNSGSEITLQTAWAAYDLKTQQVVGDANIPFDIAVGKSATILVAMRSFTDRLADPTSQSPVEIGCANGETFFNTNRFDLTNTVDFTNNISQYPKLTLLKTTPQNSILNISAPGKVFTATFRNDSDTTAEVTAVVNEQSFNYETGQIEAFGVAVCSASTTDADCLGSTEHELPLLIDAGKNVTVKVAVRYPAESYGFSPKKGVSLLLKHGYDAGGFVLDGFIPLTGLTKALKRSN